MRGAAPSEPGPVRIRLALYLGENGHKLGWGKVALLEEIARSGSISAAARSLGMAYRHAWELVDDLNRCFETPAVTATAGGRAGGGAALTPWGRELIRRFRGMEAATRRAIRADVSALDAHLARPRRRRPKPRRA